MYVRYVWYVCMNVCMYVMYVKGGQDRSEDDREPQGVGAGF